MITADGAYNLVWAEGWDADGPVGSCRDLGAWDADELPGAIARGWRDGIRHGWGAGSVYVTDLMGNLVGREV